MNPLVYFTQWTMKLDDDLPLRRRCFKAPEVRRVTWARDGEDFETWCAAVDHYMANELRDFPTTEPRTQ